MAFYEDPREFKKINIDLPFSSHLENYVNNDMYVAAHYHEMIEIVYIVNGKFTAELNGRIYEVNEGSMLFVNSDEVHSISSPINNKHIIIQFEPEILYTTDIFAIKMKTFFSKISGNEGYKRVFVADECIKNLINNIFNEMERRETGFELSVKSDIIRLFLFMYKEWQSEYESNINETELSHHTVRVIDKVIDFVKNNYKDNITARDAAKYVGLSYNYFSKLINTVMKINFSTYVNSVRLAKSEHLLISSDMPVTDIAIECGFCTTSYFIMKFKEKNGISPLAYRKKAKK